MPGSIQSVERAAAILQLVADSPANLGLSDIAEALDLAKATAHGLLRTLNSVGFLEQVDGTGKYQLGTGLTELGHIGLDPNELRSHAVNWADSLASRSGESVRVAAVRQGSDGSAFIIHHVFRPDDSAQELEVGAQVPPHATALGKVLTAWTPTLRLRADPALDSYTARTITSSKALARALVAVRAQGWAAEVEEFSVGEAAIAAPIRGLGGRVVGAIGISGPSERVCDSRDRPREQLVALVVEAARSVWRDLLTARR